MPVVPMVNTFVLGRLLNEQLFPDACTTSCTALAGNDRSNEIRPLESPPRAANSTLKHVLLWAPPVDPAHILHFLSFVVRRDALDDLHYHLLSPTAPPRRKYDLVVTKGCYCPLDSILKRALC